ncbi:MAG: hypothetical protein QXI12_12025 [Candidatus Methanomethyliaceae archaeon]
MMAASASKTLQPAWFRLVKPVPRKKNGLSLVIVVLLLSPTGGLFLGEDI